MTNPNTRRDHPRTSGSTTRRDAIRTALVATTGIGVFHSVVGIDAFTAALTERESGIRIVRDDEAVVGLTVAETVDPGAIDRLVTVQNNAGSRLSVTVALANCSHGELFTQRGSHGCAVTFDLSAGESRRIDVELADVADTSLPFVVSGSADETGFAFSLPRETTVERYDIPPVAVYDIRQEAWTDDREFIFEITHGNVWSAEWSFGDGTTATGHYHEHTYAADGTYEITLTVVIGGETHVYTDTVEAVEQPPDEDGPPAASVYRIRQEAWTDDREFVFEIVRGNVESAEWVFGDGTTATGHYHRHTYAADGTYEITLTVVIGGETYLYTDTVEVETD